MKLLLEHNSLSETEILTEESGGVKRRYISGPFLKHGEINRNKRIYPTNVMESAVDTYVNEYVKTKRALGEMGHPAGRVNVDPERACIMTESLEKEGKFFMGKAKVLSTPLGQLLENLISDGFKPAVSSRGLGSVETKSGITYVKPDYVIRTAADLVFDPSVSEAFVDCLMEETEYIKVGDLFVEKDLFESKERIKHTASVDLQEQFVKEFQNFLAKISR